MLYINMDLYFSFINKLDSELIYLLSIRQNYKLNSKNLKVFDLGGHNDNNSFISNIDNKLQSNELKKISTFKQYIFKKTFFNNYFDNISLYNRCHKLNLNRIIKQINITLLYDLCEFGDDNNYNFVCDLDSKIISKISDRIHFNYEIIKYKYINNIKFYEKIFKYNSNSEIIYYLSEFIKEPSYLENIYNISKSNNITPVLVQGFYKFYILPFSIEIQYYFLDNLLNKSI